MKIPILAYNLGSHSAGVEWEVGVGLGLCLLLTRPEWLQLLVMVTAANGVLKTMQKLGRLPKTPT